MASPVLLPTQPVRSRGMFVVIIAVLLLVFGRLCVADFTWWDDNSTIHQNPLLNPPTWNTLAHYWLHAELGLYIPVTYTLWTAIAAFAGVTPDAQQIALNPWLFHTANMLVHITATLLVFRLLSHTFPSTSAASFGAMLFGLHPIQVEAVGWISGLKDVLSGALAIGALLVWVRSPAVRGRWIAALSLYLLALLAKPGLIGLPIAIAVIDRWWLKQSWRRALLGTAAWAAVALPIAVIAKLAQPSVEVASVGVWARPFIAGDSLTFYLFKLIWPVRLAIDYGHTPRAAMASSWFYFAWIPPIVVASVVWIGRKRRPDLLVAAGVFVAGCLPVLGWTRFLFQQYSTTADHYLYFSMLGPAIFVAWLIQRWPGSRWPVTAAVCLLAGLSFRQTAYWHDDISLFTHAWEINPHGYGLANDLANVHRLNHRDPEAELWFRRAVALEPKNPAALENLVDLLASEGRYDEAIATLKPLLESMSSLPDNARPTWGADNLRMGRLLTIEHRDGEAAPYLAAAARAAEHTPSSE